MPDVLLVSNAKLQFHFLARVDQNLSLSVAYIDIVL